MKKWKSGNYPTAGLRTALLNTTTGIPVKKAETRCTHCMVRTSSDPNAAPTFMTREEAARLGLTDKIVS